MCIYVSGFMFMFMLDEGFYMIDRYGRQRDSPVRGAGYEPFDSMF